MDAIDLRATLAADGWVEEDDLDDFTYLVGPLWKRRDGEFGRYAFIAAQKHMNRLSMVHGGMLLTFADKVFGLTAWRAAGSRLIATVQLDMKFIGKVVLNDLVETRCTIDSKTGSMVFASGRMVVADATVATVSGVFKYR